MSWVDEKIKEEEKRDPTFKARFEKEQNKLDVAVALSELRHEMGLTQREFAELVGKQQSVIARIEKGTMSPSFNLINEIAVASGKKVELTFV